MASTGCCRWLVKNSTRAQVGYAPRTERCPFEQVTQLLLVLTCMSPRLYPAFPWPTTPRALHDAPRPASTHPPEHTNSYQDSESRFLGSLLSTCTHSYLLYWCTWRRGASKPWYPSHIHPYLWENDELMKYIGLPSINEGTRKEEV